jgi:hypothetical protein
MMTKLVGLGYISHDGGQCGLHVHLSRAYLGPAGGQKLIFLTEAYHDEFFRFSRRTNPGWKNWCQRYLDHRPTIEECHGIVGLDKYKAVNLLNSETIELRFFRGTLIYQTFLASIQMADTLADIARQKDFADLQTMSFDDIIDYKGYREIRHYWDSRQGSEISRNNEGEK